MWRSNNRAQSESQTAARNHPHLDGVAAPSIVPDTQHLLPGAIIAELTGDDVATAEGYMAKAPAPVLALCRILLMLGLTEATRCLSWSGPRRCALDRSMKVRPSSSKATRSDPALPQNARVTEHLND